MLPTQLRPPQPSPPPLVRFPYLVALRPRQWTKNLVVFAAPLFAFQLTESTLQGSGIAFVLFCALSSSFYLINDVIDAPADRQHPTKRHRPIAAGQVPSSVALVMAVILLVSSLVVGWFMTYPLGITLTSYALLQTGYNSYLKRTVLVDVLTIATGFVLRAYAGGAATGIPLSPWFQLCVAMLALFLAIEKRKAELRQSRRTNGKSRAVLRHYSLGLLQRMESVVTTGTITAYTLWSAGPSLQGASTPWMMVTLPFVLYGIFRYQLLSDPQEMALRKSLAPHSYQTERPEQVLLSDRPLLITIVGWIGTIALILWLKQRGLIV